MKSKNQKELIDKGLLLPLMESFYTIQGEGYHKGSAAFFIRLGGCDVGCHWCDVKESWDPDIHPPTKITDIVINVKKSSDIVVITGGEPLMWDMNPITKLLNENNIKIDYGFYITNQIMKPLQQLFALVLEDMEDFVTKRGISMKSWKAEIDKLHEKWTDPEKFNKKYEELRKRRRKKIQSSNKIGIKSIYREDGGWRVRNQQGYPV